MSAGVHFEVEGAIATITLDRPEARNAINLATAEAITAALDGVDSRNDIAVAIFAATGKVFCAGMDLKAFAATGERPITRARGGLGIVGNPPAKPLIAAVEGSALGGGFEIVLACDLVVASEDARFGLPEVKRGLVAAAGGVIRLPRKIPRNIALEMIFTGEPIAPQRAAELGLVNRVVKPGDALAAAHELAQAIAANAPLALKVAKLIADTSADWSMDDAFALQAPHTDFVRASNDAKEGARAFVEKRAPAWTGT